MGHWIEISSLMGKMHGSFAKAILKFHFLRGPLQGLLKWFTTQFQRIILSEIVRLMMLYLTECWAVKNQHKIKV